MVTDLLIRRLCDDLRPTAFPRNAGPLRPALLAALGITAALVLALLGMRADLREAANGAVFWLKLGVMVWFGGGAVLALGRLGTPGARSPAWAALMLPPVTLLAAVALGQHMEGAGGAAFWLGSSWRRCSLSIALLAVPPLALLFHALAQLAPVDGRRAGLAAGIGAGGVAAALYSLSCGEVSAGFVLLWYSFGIAIPALAGWIVGPWLLRW